DWTNFRTLTTISQTSGVTLEDLRRLLAKELTDNGLDTGAPCRVGMLDDGGFYVEDDGPGIPGEPEDVARLFSIKRPLMTSKVIRLFSRGALGNGDRVVAAVVLASDGTLEVFTNGRHLRLVPQMSGATVAEVVSSDWSKAGTRVEVRLGGSVPQDPGCLAW